MIRLASILALSLAIRAQGASVQCLWSDGFGGSTAGDSAHCQSVAVDTAGNVTGVGFFTGTVDFAGQPLTSASQQDVFLVKFDSAGSLSWAKRFGSSGTDAGYAVAVDSAGNIFITGSFSGTVDFGSGGLTSYGSGDVFLAKYSPIGTCLWSKHYGGLGSETGFGTATDAAGDVFVTGTFGQFNQTANFGGSILTNGGNQDIFLAKYSGTDGTHIWSKAFGGTGTDIGYGVSVDGNGDAIVAGAFQGTVNFGGSPLTAGGYDIFLAKYSGSNGAHAWSKSFGDAQNQWAYGVAADASGKIAITGAFFGTVNFGSGPLTTILPASSDMFLAEFAGDGSPVWSKRFGSGAGESAYGVAFDSIGNLVMTGYIYGSVDFGGGFLSPTGANGNDVFGAKFSSAGTHLWSKRAGSGGDDRGLAVAGGSNGNIVIGGYFDQQLDFGSGPLLSPGGQNGFISQFVNVSTYYVATNGSDANPGTFGSPWATIGKATATALPGDVVNVGAGTFNEFLTNTVSGTASNRITFIGTRSGTNWLTIIDPSTPMTNGWVAAPEIGAGIYKHTGTFITRELTVDNQRVAAVYDMGDISASLNQAYASPGITTGTQVLALATSATMTNLHGHVVTFWDGVEAMWGTVSTNTYLRLRNGIDPNGLAIRVSPNHPSLWTTDIVRPAINVNASYVTWRNFDVRNAFGQFYVHGSGNVIESNYLSAGYCRVRVFSGSGNTIQNNEATANYYGYATPGAWQFASGATNVIREQLYDVSKFLMGVDTSFDEGIDCLEAGANNLIAYNHVYGGIGTGVSAFSNLLSYSPTTNLVVCSNLISGHPSAGVILSEGVSSAKVFQNDVQDCNISVRFNHLDGSLDSSRVAYVYRNRLWNPANAGEAFYFHLSSGSAAAFFPTLWIWNNSFSGGGGGLEISTFAVTSGGLTNTHVLNNIFSGSTYIVNQSTAIMTNAFVLKDFAYNEVTPPLVTFPSTNAPAWWGAGNVTANAAEWSTASIPTFTLSPLSKAVDAALNVTAPFVLNGTSYAALPGPSPVMSGTAFDIGVVEMRFPPPVTHLKVAHLQWKH